MADSKTAGADTMSLVLIRHGESEWNKLNLFTGWTDVDLTDTGRREAADGGQMDRSWLPVHKAWQLNERHYGALQGLNKADAAREHGEDQVLIWRRSFDVRPPALEPGDPRDPHVQEQFRDVPADVLPYTECLDDTIARAWPYFQSHVRPELEAGRRVLVAAHGNSLRALVMKFDRLTPDEILKVNIPTGVPLAYTFDRDWNVIDKRYIGDPDTIAAKIDAVANQGKAK